jgi:hypothetical protein
MLWRCLTGAYIWTSGLGMAAMERGGISLALILDESHFAPAYVSQNLSASSYTAPLQ